MGTRLHQPYYGHPLDDHPEHLLLLQLVVETITNEPLTRLMDDRVFRPLGMTRTCMVWQDRFESDFANGYDEYGRSLGPQKRKTADAAGSMQTTVSDYARLLPDTTTDNDAIRLSYGLGWGLYWSPNGEAFFKQGSDDVIRFEIDAQGHVTHLVLHTDGQDIRIPRQ